MLTGVDTTNIRPCSVDLRLARIFRRSAKKASLTAMPKTIGLALPYTLKPGESVLAQTIEEVHQPEPSFGCLVSARSRAFRLGLSVETNVFGPYYHGPITFAIRNDATYPIELRTGDSLVQIAFIELRGETKPVEHLFQGGKVL